jgi:BirA family biotin operon repressor/biotin-[acetyl-CoA-carboxylase] ligase
MLAFHLDSVDSTNEEAKRLLLRGEVSSVAYVSAREQTAGRGSRGRTWVSPRDAGVYLSVIQRFDKGLDPATISVEGFTLAAGVACAELLHEVFDVDVRLKPINDLYVGSAKLGGILVESIVEASLVRALVTGIGLNLRSADRTLSAGA